MSKTAVWLLLILLLSASLFIMPLPAKAQPKTITVPDDCQSIQQAVDKANAGDTVYVKAGTYDGAVEITQPITLIGEDNKAVITDWYVNGRAAILITGHGVTVSGLTVDNPQNSTVWNKKRGIHLLGASNCTIQNNIVRDCNGEEIWLYQSANNDVINNTVENGDTGISVGASSHNRIVNNTVRSDSLGIYIYDNSSFNVVSGNRLISSGLSLHHGAAGNTFTENTLLKSSLGIGDFYDTYDIVNNTFYLNNFMGGGYSKAIESYDYSGTDRFDNGQEGNYYWNYQGVDLNGDGIGDTSYNIVASGVDIVDSYPLIAPWNGKNLLPVIRILSPAKNETFNTADVALSFNLSRAAQEIKYSLDGSANTTITGNFTLSNLSNGNHNVTIYAISPTGAQAKPQTVTFNVELPLISDTSLIWVAITVFLIVVAAIVAILFVIGRMNRKYGGAGQETLT